MLKHGYIRAGLETLQWTLVGVKGQHTRCRHLQEDFSFMAPCLMLQIGVDGLFHPTAYVLGPTGHLFATRRLSVCSLPQPAPWVSPEELDQGQKEPLGPTMPLNSIPRCSASPFGVRSNNCLKSNKADVWTNLVELIGTNESGLPGNGQLGMMALFGKLLEVFLGCFWGLIYTPFFFFKAVFIFLCVVGHNF